MSEELQLHLGQVLYGQASKVAINITNGSLNVFGQVPVPDQPPIKLTQSLGGHNLAKYFRRPMPVYKRVITPDPHARKGRRTENVKVGETLGFATIARQLSIVYPITEKEVKQLLEPLLKLRMEKIFLFTTCNGLGIENSDADRFGIKNVWRASGSLSDARPDYKWVNQQLKKLKSPWRIRTPDLFVTRILSPDV